MGVEYQFKVRGNEDKVVSSRGNSLRGFLISLFTGIRGYHDGRVDDVIQIVEAEGGRALAYSNEQTIGYQPRTPVFTARFESDEQVEALRSKLLRKGYRFKSLNKKQVGRAA